MKYRWKGSNDMDIESYITIGIDLGTTNSAICVSKNNEYEIIKNSYQTDYTPSVFGIDRSGNYLVGKRAYDKLYNSNSADEIKNYKAEVKRLMGTASKVIFPRAVGKEFLPEEVSAEILKSLRADVLKKYSTMQANAAVITVPSYFETLQCEATKRAGQLAGFAYVVLLQEPIAAALSYGLKINEDKNWLVYDLGGGTFDIALVQSKEGVLSVREHKGDNFLGGKDFDARIVEKIFIPRLKEQYALTDLSSESSKYSYMLTKLKYIAEETKIFLSKSNTINVELDELGQDNNGQDIYLTFSLTVDDLEDVVSDLVNKTITLVNDTISKSGIDKATISNIVLVGGPTQLPFIRKRLESAIGISVDTSVDPLTVVSHGAAIFGKSQKIPNELLRATHETDDDAIALNLQYDAVTSDTETMVVGKFDIDGDGYYVQIQSQDNQYIGDRIHLKDGKFFETLPLPKDKTTTFDIYLIDSLQNPVTIFPNRFDITQGMSASGAPIPRNIGVVYSRIQLVGGIDYKEFCEVYFKAGSTLPLKHTENFKTIRPVKKGISNDLQIKVYEGDSANIELNRILTTLEIDGSSIPFDLSEGSDIEITISINESREFAVEAYIPEFDKSLNARVAKYEEEISATQVKEKIEKIKKVYSENKGFLDNEKRESLESKIEELHAASSSESLNEEKKNQLVEQSNDVLEQLEKMDEKVSSAHKVDEIGEQIANIRNLLNHMSTDNISEVAKQVDKIEVKANVYAGDNDIVGLEECSDRLQQLLIGLLTQNIEFWIMQLQTIGEKADVASDYEKFNALKQQGINAANRNDISMLQQICHEMVELLPQHEHDNFTSNISGVTK
jgi:molecular chaperone DnaK